MSAIDTSSCFAVPPEKESGGGEMNSAKASSCTSSSSSELIAAEVVDDIFNNAYEIILAKNLHQPNLEKFTPNVVGDIIGNILLPVPNNDETALLDDEIKKIINEMKYPAESKNKMFGQGVGDQPGDKSEVKPDKILAEPVKRNTLERKNRLTNLVRNSKQMLCKFVTNEHDTELRLSKSEEIHERLVKVIDLDDHNFAEPGCSSVTGISQTSPENVMDTVDLEGTVKEEDAIGRVDDELGCSIDDLEGKKSGNVSKKKWNIGAKILKYIKRNKDHKKE